MVGTREDTNFEINGYTVVLGIDSAGVKATFYNNQNRRDYEFYRIYNTGGTVRSNRLCNE